jgi:hypothetical protein
MLVKDKGMLIPHDMDRELLAFILKDEGKSRFVVGMYIPEAIGYRFCHDTVHISPTNGELRVHSQCNSRPYQLHMYAWEHVYCLMPSAKAKRKLGTGWISPGAQDIIADPEFASKWHSGDFQDFIGKAHVASL